MQVAGDRDDAESGDLGLRQNLEQVASVRTSSAAADRIPGGNAFLGSVKGRLHSAETLLKAELHFGLTVQSVEPGETCPIVVFVERTGQCEAPEDVVGTREFFGQLDRRGLVVLSRREIEDAPPDETADRAE